MKSFSSFTLTLAGSALLLSGLLYLLGYVVVGVASDVRYAYWSITCAGTASYMVQITPDGAGAALDCRQLKAQGQGRECYKTF